MNPMANLSLLLLLPLAASLLASCLAQNDKKSENMSSTIFKFIYNNERICGDMFGNSSWLPAHQNCELKCRMDSEICQMSSESVLIRRQRCHELPVECRRRLKQLLGGADLFTKPKRREGPTGPRLLVKKQQKGMKHPPQGSIQERPSLGVVRDPPPAPIPPPPSSAFPSSSPQSPRQIHISLSGRNPLSPELIPLSQDREILIPAGHLHTASPISPPPKSTPSQPVKKGPPIQMPTPAKERSKQPNGTPGGGAKHVQSPSGKEKAVDDSLQVAYQTLYMDSSTATARTKGSGMMGSATISTIGGTTTFGTLPPTHSLQIPQGQSAEWTSAELGQPFAGNPFGPTELSVLSAPLLTHDQAGPEKKVETKQYDVFGPPMSAKQLGRNNDGNWAIHQQQQLNAPAIQPSGYLPGPIQIKPIGESKQKKQNQTTKATTMASAPNGTSLGGQYEGKTMTWWAWRALAESIRKKGKLYSTADGGILSLDKSAFCCQWALDGLCDRSWQRVRELCPKSCGNVVCSSIEGTLSCNRLVNVDVIACYEQRRQPPPLRHHFLAAPTFEVGDGGGGGGPTASSTFSGEIERFPGAEMAIESSLKPADQRAFAVEEEIKGLLGIMGRQKEEKGGDGGDDDEDGAFRRR